MQTQTVRFPYYTNAPSVDIPIKYFIGVFTPKNIAVKKTVGRYYTRWDRKTDSVATSG